MASACSGTPPPTQASRVLGTTPQANMFVQNDGSGDTTPDKGASPDQIERYVAVYRAMQRNHSMTVEQAAAAQGLTVAAFRDLERKIENDELTRDDARRELAGPVENATPTATPKPSR
ncbi:MAG: hypothetical protein ACREPW_05270 [Candidatus Binataceae bacterium]